MNKTTIFFSPVKVLWKQYLIVILSNIIRGCIGFGFVYLLQQLAYSIQINNIHRFRIWAIILIATLVVSLSINIFNNYYVNVMARDVSNYLDAIHLKKFLQMDNNIVEKLGTGKMSSIFQRGLIAWVTLLWSMTTSWIRIVTTITLAIVYLAMQGMQFLLLGLGLIVIGVLWIRIFHGKGRAYRIKQKEVVGNLDRLLVRRIMSKFEILQLGRYEEEVARDKRLNDEWSAYRQKEGIWNSICYDGAGFLIQVIMIGMLVYVGYFVIRGSYQFSDYVLFGGLMTLFGGIVTQFGDMGKQYFDNWIHISKFHDVMYDESTYHHTTFNGTKFAYSAGEIVFKDASYNYGSGNVIDSLSLTIAGGKKTALVGPSGGGKTTLTKLLSGYLQPTTGQILVDGQDLSTVNISSYYHHLGYLTQDPLIFDGTIRENLVYAFSGIPSEEQMKEALLRAKCEFIFELKDGLESEIGERGIRLSGGQRQRLAIAKLFLKNPEIIILDEPTSALDSISEQAVTEAFQNLFAGRTVIVIAHRLQTVKEADEILMIEYGKVVERGTHKELSTAGGIYQKMLELQSGFVG